ncbi:MAG TPA: Smr/MutS family protein [Bacillota bacterium]|nr:Smr/MutS family protein [Bacillota bacterium]
MAAKVREINLESGMPDGGQAMKRMMNGLTTAKQSGCRAVILIHGYGSSGAGGIIKKEVGSKLRDPSLRGIVRDNVKGENWIIKKKEFLDICPALREFERHIDGNNGITVVILK